MAWEGAARPGNDATAGFRTLTAEAGFRERLVLTRSAVREAKNFLKGAALTPDGAPLRPKEIQDLVKRLKTEDQLGLACRVLRKVLGMRRSAPTTSAPGSRSSTRSARTRPGSARFEGA